MKMKKIFEYEVYMPMPYCEIWIVEGTSIRDIKKRIAQNGVTELGGYCVGEVSSRKNTIRKLDKKAKGE